MVETYGPRVTADHAPMSKSITASLALGFGIARISIPTTWEALWGRVDRQACDRRLAWWGETVVRVSQARLVVSGKEHLPADKACLMMSNHPSWFDIMVLLHAVTPSLRMVTKQELFRVPIWGQALRASGFIAIDRSNREKAIASLAQARAEITRGTPVWIAPEGTRARDGRLLPFKKGGFVLAIEAGIPILPIGLAGTFDVMPKGAFAMRTGRSVGVALGPPIDPAGKHRDTLMAEVREAIQGLIARADHDRARV